MNGSRYAIEIDGLSKSYGKCVALQNLSLRVAEGSVYGLVGPRGAGKTTTLRTLATLEQFDNGAARVAGFELPGNPSGVRDHVAYMPEKFGKYGDLTVDEYLDFYGQGYGISAPARGRLRNDLLELMDLTEMRDRAVDVLPLAMKQRLSLARCLIHDPAVLLLDEPFAGVDHTTRSELAEVMAELAKLGKTILLTCNDASQLPSACTHLGILEDGALVQEGPLTPSESSPAADAWLHLRLRNPVQLQSAMQVLVEAPVCSSVEVLGDKGIAAQFGGSERDLSALLAALAAAGISVTGFELESSAPDNRSGQESDLGASSS